jgi:pimeloyl-ACP methyl ester carboxylesterase
LVSQVESATDVEDRQHTATPPGPDPQAGYAASDGEWLRIDWSERLAEVAVESVRGTTPVSYVEMGEGPAILLVHGLSGSWRNWLENIPYLARRHRVVALDLPGFGLSPMPEYPISIKSYGNFLGKFSDRIGLDQETALVGHSMGGFIATEAAILNPERFSSLTLVAAAGITYARMRRSQKDMARPIVKMMMPIAADSMERNFGRSRLRAAQFSGVMAHPEKISREMLWELGSYGVRAPATLQAAYELAGYDTRERLSEITLPTLLIWGNKDLLVPVSAAFAYRKRLPQAEMALIDDTGHMVQIERPARFNQDVEEFIDRNRPDAG